MRAAPVHATVTGFRELRRLRRRVQPARRINIVKGTSVNKSIIAMAVAAVLGTGIAIGGANAQAPQFKGNRTVAAKPAPKIVAPRSAPRIVAQRPAPRHSNRNRNIGLGAAAAILGTAIAIEAARSSSARSYREELSCPALERRCDDGQNWACRRLEEREDC